MLLPSLPDLNIQVSFIVFHPFFLILDIIYGIVLIVCTFFDVYIYGDEILG